MAKTGIYRVHAVALGAPWSDEFFPELEKLFLRVCAQEVCKYGDAGVWWWSFKPANVEATDAVVWLLPDKESSLIKKVYKTTPPKHVAGMTQQGSKGTISEVYLDHPAFNSASSQAKMAFHELMHNKAMLGDEMHGRTFGLGREMLDMSSLFSANLTYDDMEIMGPAMSKPVPQYLGE